MTFVSTLGAQTNFAKLLLQTFKGTMLHYYYLTTHQSFNTVTRIASLYKMPYLSLLSCWLSHFQHHSALHLHLLHCCVFSSCPFSSSCLLLAPVQPSFQHLSQPSHSSADGPLYAPVCSVSSSSPRPLCHRSAFHFH